MSDDHEAVPDFARAIGPLAPRADVRARVLASIDAAPQEVAAPPRRPWALGAAAAAVLLGVMLWLGSRSSHDEEIASEGTPAAARHPWDEPAEAAVERTVNLATYERLKIELHEKHRGKWVCIGPGEPLRPKDTAEEAFRYSRTSGHRFVFRVGDEGPREAEFFSRWYSPRFAGTALPAALGAEWTLGGDTSTLTKTGKPAQLGVGPVFPRLRFDLEGPARRLLDDPPPVRLAAEVFVGTVGPPLMLTPEDAVALNLANAEIPGEVTVWQRFRCRQALVRVSVAGWNEPQIVTALWPIEPRSWLTALARERDRFWDWGGTLGETALAAAPAFPTLRSDQPAWLLFGRDRVLARGATPDDLLRAIESDPEPTYHRFLMRWPREGPLVLDERGTIANITSLRLDGRETPCRMSLGPPEPFVLLEPAEAAALQVDSRAESPRELRLLRKDGSLAPLQGGYVRIDIRPTFQGAVLAVYVLPAPPPPPPAPMPAPDPHRGGR